jgi:hypothetical protein
LTSHKVRELLAGFRGLPMARAMNLLATLPWLSLLQVAQAPSAAPPVRRGAERRLLNKILKMTAGEKIALARRAHRPLFGRLIAQADAKILVALLNNPRLVENDILLMLNTITPPSEFILAVARHSRWGQYYGVRKGLVECAQSPLPVALAAMVQLRRSDLEKMATGPHLSEAIRSAAFALLQKNKTTAKKVITCSGDVPPGTGPDTPEGLR